MRLSILGLYAGRVQPMPGDGRPTAIFKRALEGRVDIGREGLAGDAQGDRRFHGGPDKAVHHFPAENYASLAARFPQIAANLAPGALGENLSTEGADERAVCIGDVFAVGSARVQLCQPRTPCWKIEARHGVAGLTEFIAATGSAGWYYRVLAPGAVEAGETFELIAREAESVTLAGFWDIVHAHRPQPEALARLIEAPGLAENWRHKLRQRRSWLDSQRA